MTTPSVSVGNIEEQEDYEADGANDDYQEGEEVSGVAVVGRSAGDGTDADDQSSQIMEPVATQVVAILLSDEGAFIWEYLRLADYQRLRCSCRALQNQNKDYLMNWWSDMEIIHSLSVKYSRPGLDYDYHHQWNKAINKMSASIKSGNYHVEYRPDEHAETLIFPTLREAYQEIFDTGNGRPLNFEYGWGDGDMNHQGINCNGQQCNLYEKINPREITRKMRWNHRRSARRGHHRYILRQRKCPHLCNSKFCAAYPRDINYLYSVDGKATSRKSCRKYCGACLDRDLCLALRFIVCHGITWEWGWYWDPPFSLDLNDSDYRVCLLFYLPGASEPLNFIGTAPEADG